MHTPCTELGIFLPGSYSAVFSVSVCEREEGQIHEFDYTLASSPLTTLKSVTTDFVQKSKESGNS